MSAVENVHAYIYHLCDELGTDPMTLYNEKTSAWYFTKNDTTVEVFLTTQKNADEPTRTFLRCMSPLCNIPHLIPQQVNLFQAAMAINGRYLGFKISSDEKRGLICAVTEQNIEGMTYDEMVGLINDAADWAKRLHQVMQQSFAG